jgi:hypothetical protein
LLRPKKGKKSCRTMKKLFSYKYDKNINLNLYSPINCQTLKNVSYILTIILAFSILLNFVLLLALRHLKKSPNYQNDLYLITITAFNLVGSVIIFPFLIVSCFNCRWENFIISFCLFVLFKLNENKKMVFLWLGKEQLFF